MSNKRTFDDYYSNDYHYSSTTTTTSSYPTTHHDDYHQLCEPDFSLQAFLPYHHHHNHHSEPSSNTIHHYHQQHFNCYESSLKKKKLFIEETKPNLNTNHSTTNQLYNNNLQVQPNNFKPHHSEHEQHYPIMMMEDEPVSSSGGPIGGGDSNDHSIHDSYIYRKHLQHVEYLHATVINQQLNNRKNHHSNNIINFQVKGLSGQTISFSQVDIESSSLFDLQQIIHEQFGIPIQKQRIVLKGRIIQHYDHNSGGMTDHHGVTKLSEIIGIENNCTFQIVCALKGG